MRQGEKEKRKYIIIGLCAVLMIMVVGYAAFAQQLKINGTAEISSSWCLGFDKTLGTVTKTTGVTGATQPSGTISYNGNQCGVKSQVGAMISATLNQPGDEVNYLLTIINEGSLPAAIRSITVNNQTVTSNTTVGEGNILFTVEMPGTTSLAAGASTTMNVKAKFQNTRDVTGPYLEDEDYSITVNINAEQDNGNGGFEITDGSYNIYTWGNIYNNHYLTINGTNTNSYGVVDGVRIDYTDSIANLTKNVDYITENDYPTSQSRVNKIGHNIYIRHKIIDDIIMDTYLCFISDTEHCMKSAYYDDDAFDVNKGIVQDYQTYYASQNPTCTLNGDSYGGPYSSCLGGGYNGITAYLNGTLTVIELDGFSCSAGGNGSSGCRDSQN